MAEKTVDKLKRMFGFADDEAYYDDYQDDYQEEPETHEDRAPIESTNYKRSTKTKTSSTLGLVITVQEPLSYDESPLIVDDLRQRKAIVLNFEQLDTDVKRQIFDFVNGAIYALDGSIQKVNKDIFILAPSNVEIDGLKETLKNNGMFPW